MIKHRDRKGSLYGRFSLITLISVYLLILVGGIVRTTGSGMGCPDWPKCFDQWVPPTSEAELPSDYREIYSAYRAEKNEKFARYLTFFGMDETAEELRTDESIREERPFNKYNTIIEYLNRLLGALIGLFILLTFVFSLRYFNTDRRIFYAAGAALVLVIFQGWIGSIVVSTNLLPWMVTIHMLIAIVIVFILEYLVYRSRYAERQTPLMKHRTILLVLVVLGMGTMVAQIILGTQVREGIDVVATQLGEEGRELWIGELGKTFLVHRSFSWIILILNVGLFVMYWKQKVRLGLIGAIVALVLLSVITGVIMNYMGMPAFIQPVHLLFGTLIIGLHFFLFLQLKNQKAVQSVKI